MNGLHTYGSVRVSTALLLCCAMLLLGAAAGYGLGGRERVEIEAPPEALEPPAAQPLSTQEDAAAGARPGAETVAPDAKVVWVYQMVCGHTAEVEDAQPVIDKTRAELEAAYGAAAVESFSAKEVRLRLTSERFCPRHYVLYLENGALTVRKTDEALAEQVLLTLDVSLPADAAAECAEGLPFDSLEDINVYLEGLEG